MDWACCHDTSGWQGGTSWCLRDRTGGHYRWHEITFLFVCLIVVPFSILELVYLLFDCILNIFRGYRIYAIYRSFGSVLLSCWWEASQSDAYSVHLQWVSRSDGLTSTLFLFDVWQVLGTSVWCMLVLFQFLMSLVSRYIWPLAMSHCLVTNHKIYMLLFGQICLGPLTLSLYMCCLLLQKTKPTQHSVRGLRGLGLTPNILACRSTKVNHQTNYFCTPSW